MNFLMDIMLPKITFSCISLIFIEMKFIHYYSYMMLAMKSMNICSG